MSGQTLTEKIFSQKLGRKVVPGDEIVVEPDVIMSHDSTTRWAIDSFRDGGAVDVRCPEKIVIAFDHAFPAPNPNMVEYHTTITSFAKEHNLERIFNKTPRGISHQVLPEEGLVLPGGVVMGGDSHSCTYGAFANFGWGVGSTEIAAAWASGEALFSSVPETYLVQTQGSLRPGVYAKDLMLNICKEVGWGGATDFAAEYQGRTIEELDMESRMTLSNMAVEIGATTGLINADEITLNWLRPRVKQADQLYKICADENAQYARRVDIDVAGLGPMVALPPRPDNVKPVSELSDLKIDRAFIGTCTNSRPSDWEIAWKILKGNKVKIPLLMTPASSEVWDEVQKRGYVIDLAESGVEFAETGCSACLGRIGVWPEDGENVLTTMNRNIPGRMGNKTAKIYLASPATVATSALTGYLTSEAIT